jgi:hypothetical protein
MVSINRRRAKNMTVKSLSATTLLLGAAFAAAAATECPEISTHVRDRLVPYIKLKYGVAPTTVVAMEQTGLQQACYRQIRFFSKSPGRPFEVDLYLSPDENTSVPDLMMVEQDPARASEMTAVSIRGRLNAVKPERVRRCTS